MIISSMVFIINSLVHMKSLVQIERREVSNLIYVAPLTLPRLQVSWGDSSHV